MFADALSPGIGKNWAAASRRSDYQRARCSNGKTHPVSDVGMPAASTGHPLSVACALPSRWLPQGSLRRTRLLVLSLHLPCRFRVLVRFSQNPCPRSCSHAPSRHTPHLDVLIESS